MPMGKVGNGDEALLRGGADGLGERLQRRGFVFQRL